MKLMNSKMMMLQQRTKSLLLHFVQLVSLDRNSILLKTFFLCLVGKPKTTEKRLIDMNTVIANIERQQQEDERLR